MRIEPIFYAAILAAIIYKLSSPDECSAYASADSGDLVVHELEGRHVADKRRRGVYASGVPP